MRVKLRVVLALLLAIVVGPLAAVGASTGESIAVKHATVTLAKKGHPSAVSFTLTNQAGSTIWITEVSSPLSTMGMIDYDPDMTVKASHMISVSSIKVRAGHTVTFSLQGRGAMLGAISKNLKTGTRIRIVLGWHSKASPATTQFTFRALVVKAPQKIYFGGSSSGSMPGMNMG